MASVDYQRYMKSKEWKAKREWALERAGSRCQLCNSTAQPNVHHRTYKNLGHEKPGDLIVLCADCHERFHKRLPEVPLPPVRRVVSADEALVQMLVQNRWLLPIVSMRVDSRHIRDRAAYEIYEALGRNPDADESSVGLEACALFNRSRRAPPFKNPEAILDRVLSVYDRRAEEQTANG